MTKTTFKLEKELLRQPTYEIDPVYLNRWSPRSFSEKEVTDEVLLSVFEAARWAPSAFKLQPWKFIIARDFDTRKKFYQFIGEINRTWCEKAPVLALIISKVNSENGENRSHTFDTGAAWGYLSLEATRKGLITHPMTGIDFNNAREILNIPDDFWIDALIAIGYHGEKELLSEGLQEREQPSDRVPLQELLFEGEYGEKLR